MMTVKLNMRRSNQGQEKSCRKFSSNGDTERGTFPCPVTKLRPFGQSNMTLDKELSLLGL